MMITACDNCRKPEPENKAGWIKFYGHFSTVTMGGGSLIHSEIHNRLESAMHFCCFDCFEDYFYKGYKPALSKKILRKKKRCFVHKREGYRECDNYE